jgi:hypothetical protein
VAPLMQSKPPRFLPTLALAVLWLAIYFLWVAVRPAPEPATPTRPTKGSVTTTTTTVPLFKLKP